MRTIQKYHVLACNIVRYFNAWSSQSTTPALRTYKSAYWQAILASIIVVVTSGQIFIDESVDLNFGNDTAYNITAGTQ